MQVAYQLLGPDKQHSFVDNAQLLSLSLSLCIFLFPGQTENFQNGFEVDSLTLDRLPLAFYNGLYAYGGW